MTRRTIRLDLPQEARGDTPYRDMPIGDGEFKSDDPRFGELKMVVGKWAFRSPARMIFEWKPQRVHPCFA